MTKIKFSCISIGVLLFGSLSAAYADDNWSKDTRPLPGFAYSSYPIRVEFSKEKGWRWLDARYMRSVGLLGAVETMRKSPAYRQAPPTLASRLSAMWLDERKEFAEKLGTSCVSIGCDISSSDVLVSSFIRNESTDPSVDKAAIETLAAVTKALKPDSPFEPVDRYVIEFHRDQVKVIRIGRIPSYPDAFFL